MRIAAGFIAFAVVSSVASLAVAGEPIVREVILESAHVGKQHVVFVLPPDYDSTDTRYPTVLAMAGLGESVRGNKAGAWGWVEKYGVVPAMAALHRGQLTKDDFQGLVKDDALARYNAVLAKEPYRGVILVCPYPPNLNRGIRQLDKYERFWFDELMPHVDANLRTTGQWGLGGISLGGLTAKHVGFKYPEKFAAISSQQASVKRSRPRLVRMAKEKLEALKATRVNIATSHRDGYRDALRQFHEDLDGVGLPHRFVILRGAHNKAFVKGPGSLEILLFHDRALRGSEELP